MSDRIVDRVERAMGKRPVEVRPLSGGCVGEVYRAEMGSGERVVVKVDGSASARLDIEGRMLRDLGERSELPVPRVLHSTPDLLVMEYIDEASGEALGITDGREEHAADLLAALHTIGPLGERAGWFGYDYDTLIGGLHQPNPWMESWTAFFAEHRLASMAREAMRAGRLGSGTVAQVERLGERLEGVLGLGAVSPSLIHGDVWGGNVIASGRRICGFIDPAIYYAHSEVELAFITMFHTFGKRFFDRYREHRPIEAGFWEVRREVYTLYPLLVHVRLFGGGYVGQVEGILRRFAG